MRAASSASGWEKWLEANTPILLGAMAGAAIARLPWLACALVFLALWSAIKRRRAGKESQPEFASVSEPVVDAPARQLRGTSEATPLLEILQKTVIGQDDACRLAVVGLLAGCHVLIEGVPGVAKTLLCKTIAAAVRGSFARIQFTSDLMPSDITGSQVFEREGGGFKTLLGPIFANVVVADEINRAPGRVHSALLEAMEEHQLTIGGQSYLLPQPFYVIATMNREDSCGTYELPQAVLDRFALSIRMSVPAPETEEKLLAPSCRLDAQAVVSLYDLLRWRNECAAVQLSQALSKDIVRIVTVSRRIARDSNAGGPGPRASIFLAATAKASAWLDGRASVESRDIYEMAPAILRHRIAGSVAGWFDGTDPDRIVEEILAEAA